MRACVRACVSQIWTTAAHTWLDSSPQRRSGARTSACAGCRYRLGWHMGLVPGPADLEQDSKAQIKYE